MYSYIRLCCEFAEKTDSQFTDGEELPLTYSMAEVGSTQSRGLICDEHLYDGQAECTRTMPRQLGSSKSSMLPVCSVQEALRYHCYCYGTKRSKNPMA